MKFKNKKLYLVQSIKAAIILLCLAGLINSHIEASQEEVAVITKIRKNVQYKRDGDERWEKAVAGDYLYRGDHIKAERKSSAEISFISGIEVNVEQNTEFEIKETPEGGTRKDTELELYKGEIFNRVKKLSNLKIRTPQAVAAVRGTKFGMELDQQTRVYVVEGVVDVYNQQGKVELTEGKETLVEEGGAPAGPKDIDKETLKDKEEYVSRPQLQMSIVGAIHSARPVEMKLSVLDSEGNLKDDINQNVQIKGGENILLSENPAASAKWKKLPEKLKLKNGQKKFFIKTYEEGMQLISASSKGLSSSAVELNFMLPGEKEMILELDNDYELKLKFKKK